MRQPNIAQIVYEELFPCPRPNDPTSFSSHVTRNLVPEVRIETATFYGALDCIEAQYPGLDYACSPHRRRLSRFQWHRRLFRAFDKLGLTRDEIHSICQWEGTKSAKDKYERDAGQEIRNTTMDGIAVASRPSSPRAYFPQPKAHVRRYEGIVYDVMRHRHGGLSQHNDSDEEGSVEEDISDPTQIESVGVELNRRLLAAAEARARGDDVVLDEQWEQWMKDMLERNAVLPPHLRAQLGMDTVSGGAVGHLPPTAFDNNNSATSTAGSSRQPPLRQNRSLNGRSPAFNISNPTRSTSNSAAGQA